MDFRQAVEFIWNRTDYERQWSYNYSAERFDLARVYRLLERLGSPQRGLVAAHIAGTKGKGSTAAMLASILRAAGLRVGLYTSPHLHSVRERIQVDGRAVTREAFAQAVASVAAACEGLPEITSFEALTAAAFVAFRQHNVEAAVVEVGLGGRLDATNVIRPFVSVITSLSYDHTAILGRDLASIAREKAGIVKDGIPVVSASQPEEAMAVIREAAKEHGSRLYVAGADWRYRPLAFNERAQSFAVYPPGEEASIAAGEFTVPLLGEHQLENAVLALAAAALAPKSFGLRREHLALGLQQVHWPGRFEVVGREPAVVLDGAHNVDSMAKLLLALRRHLKFERLFMVFGASRDKDVRGMLALLPSVVTKLYLCRSRHERALAPEELSQLAGALAVPHATFGSVEEALWAALAEAKAADCVCVCGSLFVVAAAREALAMRFGWIEREGDDLEVLAVTSNERRQSVAG